MWPFKQKLEAPAAEGPKPVPAPVIRRDWVGLPPIQRIVGAHPLTAPSDQFRDDLATHQDPSVSTDTMGHQVSAEAPPGLVLALARPTTRSDGPAMIPRRRVQRSVAGAVAESGEWDGDEAASDLTRPTPLPTGSASTVGARELPVVAPEPAIQRLTRLPPDAEPTPVPPVQRSRVAPTSPTLSSPSDEPFEMPASPHRLTLGQSRRLGLGAPIRQVPDHGVQRAATDSMPLAPSQFPTVPQRGTVSMDASPATRLPMDASPGERMPIDSVAQRAPMDLTLSGKAPIDLSPGVKETRTSTLGVPPAPSPDATDEPRLDLPLALPPIAPPAPSVQLSATSSVEPASDSSVDAPPAVQRLAEGGPPTPSSTESPPTLTVDAPTASMPRASIPSLPLVSDVPALLAIAATAAPSALGAIAPLASARSLRPTSTIQRSASTPHPDPAHAGNPATLTTMAPPQGEREFPLMRASEGTPHPDPSPQEERERPFARGSDDSPGLTLIQRARQDTPHPDPAHPGDRATLTTMPPPQGGREFPLTRGREDGAREQQPLPLAPSRGVSVQRASQPVDDTENEPAGAGDEPFGPTVQGAWYEAPVAVSRVSAGAAMAESSTASAGPHQASETEMDELARKLYDRLRTRLKTELLVDRERAGFLTDLR